MQGAKNSEEMKTAIRGPCRSSIGRCMYPRKPVSSQIPADAAEPTTAIHFSGSDGMKEKS
jgi:hypothetical protein